MKIWDGGQEGLISEINSPKVLDAAVVSWDYISKRYKAFLQKDNVDSRAEEKSHI